MLPALDSGATTAKQTPIAPDASSDGGFGNGIEARGVTHDHSVRYVWYVIALLTIVNVFNYMDRFAFSMLAPSVQADLNLSDGQLGLLIGFAFSLFYAICGIPIARLADRGNRRNIVAMALAVWSVMTALTGAAHTFWHVLVARLGVGAGEAGGLAPAQSIICDYVPLQRRAGIFGLHGFGAVGGIMFGMALSGWLAEAIGWRWAFAALGLPGIILSLVVKLTLREPDRGQFDTVKDDGRVTSFQETLAFLWSCRTYRLLVLLFLVNGLIQYGLNQWWPSFYARVHGLDMAFVGLNLGIAMGVGAGIGLIFGGLLANRVAQRNSKLPLIIGAAATGLSLPTAIASLFVSPEQISIVFAGLTQLCWNIPMGAITAALYSVVMPSMRATGAAIAFFFSAGLGFGFGPFCVGMLSDILTPQLGLEALRYALLAPIMLIPLSIIALLAAAQALPNDLKLVSTQT